MFGANLLKLGSVLLILKLGSDINTQFFTSSFSTGSLGPSWQLDPLSSLVSIKSSTSEWRVVCLGHPFLHFSWWNPLRTVCWRWFSSDLRTRHFVDDFLMLRTQFRIVHHIGLRCLQLMNTIISLRIWQIDKFKIGNQIVNWILS